MIVLSKQCCNHVRIRISIESDDDDMMRMLYNANVKKWRVLSFEGLKTKDIVYSIEVDGGQLRMLWACKGVSNVSYSIVKKKISAKGFLKYFVMQNHPVSSFKIGLKYNIQFCQPRYRNQALDDLKYAILWTKPGIKEFL